MNELTVRHMTPEEMPLLYALRARILRPGQPVGSAVFVGDDLPTTVHLGAFTSDGECVGIATLLDCKGVQLRGMAVAPELQGQGVGGALLQAIHRTAEETGPGSLWCNARVSAVGFYERLGWMIEGDQFEVPGVGPHYVMRYRPKNEKGGL